MSDPLVDYLRKCCLKVRGERSGCGFYIAPQLLVTCAHVVGRDLKIGDQVQLQRWEQEETNNLIGEIVGISPEDDIALLQTKIANSAYAPLSSEARTNDNLAALGFIKKEDREEFDQLTALYEGETLFLTSSGRRGIESKFKSGQVEPGYSGGPLLNLSTGYVMGVVVATRDKLSDLGGWAIEVSVINSLLQKSGQQLLQMSLQWQEAKAQQKPSKRIQNTILPRSGAVNFIGREDKLSELHKHLEKEGKCSIASITGMAGVGKTELAIQYANNNESQYQGGQIWLDARQDLILEISNSCIKIFGVEPPKDLDPKEKASFFWSKFRGELPVLIIVDNLKDYREVTSYLPCNNSRFKLIIILSEQLGISVPKVTLDILIPEKSLELFKSLSKRDMSHEDEYIGKQICEWLGHLPLAIELVGRYLYRRNNESLRSLKERLEDEGIQANPISIVEQDMTNPIAVNKAFELIWEPFSKEEKEVAYTMSLFAQDPIPWELIPLSFPKSNKYKLEDIREDVLIHSYFLADRGNNTFQYHQLIRKFLNEIGLKNVDNPDSYKKAAANTLGIISKSIPESINKNLSLELAVKIPHIIEATKNLTSFIDEEYFIPLYTGLGRFFEEKGLYKQAEYYYSDCQRISENRFGKKSVYTAKAIFRISVVYYQQGQYEKSEKLLKDLLANANSINLDELLHADILNGLALLLKEKGNFKEAELQYKKSLKIREMKYGKRHPEVSDILNNLALLYDEGYEKSEEAESLFLEALDIRKEYYGESHIRVANVLNSLGTCYFYQEKYLLAKKRFKQALSIYRELYGSDEHRDIAVSINNLAQVYAKEEDYEKAKQALLNVREVQEKILGLEHKETMITINNLAAACEDSGDKEQAEILYKKVLRLREKVVGRNHIDYAISLNNLGKFYQLNQEASKAKPLYLEALEILEKKIGQEHSLYRQIKENFDALE